MRYGLVLLVLLGACNEQFLDRGAVTVSAAPTLLDLGSVAVGSERVGRVTMVVENGAARVVGVSILPTLGDGFLFEGELPFGLDADDANGIDVIFRPGAVGYASAVLSIETDADEQPAAIEVRARGVASSLVGVPALVDLGVVAKGDTGSSPFSLQNDGDLELTVLEGLATRGDVVVSGVLPFALPAGMTQDLVVSYAAPDIAPMLARLSFRTPGAVVPDVIVVRANDCERGLPDAYDKDGDGVTSCGGDCDDTRDDVGPGSRELADGRDNDCDRTVDEGTEVYDDDGDGYCEAASCVGGARPGDCHDADVDVSPGDDEVFGNDVDDDCDGVLDPDGVDADGDGFAAGVDCADSDETRHPHAEESVNGLDDDCDGVIDNDTVVFDDDGDGYCESLSSCREGATPGDCDDTSTARAPDAEEAPNGVDDDCDVRVDEGTVRGDDDGDGFTELGGDCDDADADVNPARGTCPT